MDYYNAMNTFGMNTYSDREMEDNSPVWDENEGREDQTLIEEYIEKLTGKIGSRFNITKVKGEDYETYSIKLIDDTSYFFEDMEYQYMYQVDMHICFDGFNDACFSVYVDGFSYIEEEQVPKRHLLNLNRILAIFSGFSETHYLIHHRRK